MWVFVLSNSCSTCVTEQGNSASATSAPMVQMTLQAVATPNKSLIGTNCIYASASDLATLGIKDGGFIQVKSMVFMVNSDAGHHHCSRRPLSPEDHSPRCAAAAGLHMQRHYGDAVHLH